MLIVVFGLTISSSWGNGHATLWRGLARGLATRGARLIFFERDVPYYAAHRDLDVVPGGELILYRDWDEVAPLARRKLSEADAAMVTSYCPDAAAASEMVIASGAPRRIFYDLDTPVTLASLDAGEPVPYLPEGGLGEFDIVLSYGGGGALNALRDRLGARRAAPLYGHVDPQAHCPRPPDERYRADLSFLGSYAADRQAKLEAMFVEPARRRPQRRFLIGGALYPDDFPWAPNIWFARHVAPQEHPAFLSASRLTLNVTREAMARMGWCPSGRLFEAAACGCPVLSDAWEGLDAFFALGEEVLLARDSDEASAALDLSDGELRRIGEAARVRALAEHTSQHRADELLSLLDDLHPAEA